MKKHEPMHKAHPWHGIDPLSPEEVRAFIEIVPTDTVKYEVDKQTGYLALDRPQKFSNIVPSLYGFIPRTYCSTKMAELTNKAMARFDVEGDGDPLDICVLTEKDVTHGDILVTARPIWTTIRPTTRLSRCLKTTLYMATMRTSTNCP